MLPSRGVTISFARPNAEVGIASLPLLAALPVALVRPEMSYADPVLRGMMALLIVSSLYLLLLCLRRRPVGAQVGAIVVYGGFVLWYSYPGFLFVTVGPPDWYAYPVGWQVPLALSVLLFCIALGLSVRLPSRQQTSVAESSLQRPPGTQRLTTVGAVVLVMIGLIPYLGQLRDPVALTQLLLASRSIGKPWVPVSNLGALETLLPAISVMTLTAGSALLTCRLAVGSGSGFLRTLGLIPLIVVVAAVVLDHGTRVFLVLIFGPAAIILLYRTALRSRGRAIAAALVFTMIMVSSAQVVGAIRNAGWRYRSQSSMLRDWYKLGGSVDYFSETAFAIGLVPSRHEFFQESSLLQFLTYPVPRGLWPQKPVPRVIRFYVLERWHQDLLRQGGNVFPGIVGQEYMSWGFPGVLVIGLFVGVLGTVIGRQVSNRLASWDTYSSTAWLMVAIWLLLSFRVLSPVFLTPALLAFGVIALGHRLPTKRMCPASSRPPVLKLQ